MKKLVSSEEGLADEEVGNGVLPAMTVQSKNEKDEWFKQVVIHGGIE